MPIVSSEIVSHVNKPNGGRRLSLQAADHTGKIWERRPIVSADTDDEAFKNAWALSLESELPEREADMEVRRAKNGQRQNAQHQTQAQLDRRVLRNLMQIDEPEEFAKAIPWFIEFLSRAGNNITQRAAYLGVNQTKYGQVQARFNRINTFITERNADIDSANEFGSDW